jgi:histidine triad (HIT) family protein
MSQDPDCIFCKIIAGDIPSFKVLDDDKVIAFMDVNPAAEGHALVVPKFHAANILDVSPEWLAATIEGTRRVARAIQATLKPDGMNLIQATGPGAAQSVQHIHFHVLPRCADDGLTMNWGHVPGDMDAIGDLAQRIAANVE